jgi:hypothetical protein
MVLIIPGQSSGRLGMRHVYLAVIFVVMTTLVFTALVPLEKALG